MFKYTQTTLQKIEGLFKELGYQLRYEKGNFRSGYCIVVHQKIVVISRYFDIEGRINTLVDILNEIAFNPDEVSEESRKFLQLVYKAKASV